MIHEGNVRAALIVVDEGSVTCSACGKHTLFRDKHIIGRNKDGQEVEGCGVALIGWTLAPGYALSASPPTDFTYVDLSLYAPM